MSKIICLNIDTYAKLYHSLVSMCDMHPQEALEMLYMLNTANLDTFRGVSDAAVYERSPQHFCQSILCRQRAHMTLIGLYKGLERLESNIIFRYLTDSQRNACKKLRTVMRSIRQSFYSCYGMEIDEACLLVKSVCNKMKVRPTDYDNETLYAYVTSSLQKQIFPCAVSLTPIEVTRG